MSFAVFPFYSNTHTHTHIDTLYIEAKTKNKAGVFFLFSPSLFCFLFPPYLHIFSYPPLPHNFLSFPTSHFFISLFLPATSFLSNIPLSFPPPNFLPYLHLSFPVSSFCSLLIFLKPFSSLPPHFISLSPYLPSLIPSSPSSHPHCVSFLLLPYLHISSMFHPLSHCLSSLPILFFLLVSFPTSLFFLVSFSFSTSSISSPYSAFLSPHFLLLIFCLLSFLPPCLFPSTYFPSLSLPSLSLYFFLPLCPHFALIFSASQSPRFFSFAFFAFLYLLLPSSKCLFLTSLLLFSFPPCPCIILLFSTSHLPIVSFHSTSRFLISLPHFFLHRPATLRLLRRKHKGICDLKEVKSKTLLPVSSGSGWHVSVLLISAVMLPAASH